MKEVAQAWFEGLQDRITADLERLEDEAEGPAPSGRFVRTPWLRGENQGGGTIVDTGRTGGRDGAILFESRFEAGDFGYIALARLFIGIEYDFALASSDGNRSNFFFERSVRLCSQCAAHRFCGECILFFTCEMIFLGT